MVVRHFGQAPSGEKALLDGQLNLTHQKLKTPRAAALAGILFTVLFTSTVVLLRLSVPPIRRTPALGSEKEQAPSLWR